MRYVLKVVYATPSGDTHHTRYLVAEDEAEMKAILSCQRESGYIGVTCLGPVVSPSKDMLRNLADGVVYGEREA